MKDRHNRGKRDPLTSYYPKIPKFYKDLGWEACNAYCFAKFVRRDSTAHWVLNYGRTPLAFWAKYYPRAEILERIRVLRKASGKRFPRSYLGLEVFSINKPFASERYKKFNVPK